MKLFKLICLLLIFFLCIEFGITIFNIDQNILPFPSNIISEYFDNFEYINNNLITSLTTALFSILISFLLSIFLGILIDRYKNLRFFITFISILQLIPPIVIAPIFVLLFGFSPLTIYLFVIIFSIFPLLILIVNSFDNIDYEYLIYFNLLTRNKLKQYFLFKIPYITKEIYKGLILIITYSLTSTVTIEFITGQSGIGVVLSRSLKNFNIELTYVIIFFIITITVSLLKILETIYKRSRYAKIY